MVAARTSQLRYDADTNARKETLKYYYDGQNVIAEYDESDNRSRRYIHGTHRIDERAVMLSGPFFPDTFYYVLQELDTVTGLITKNGSLAEAYTYDAYGKVSVWGYPPSDFNRDGDSDFGDVTPFNLAYDSDPATDPMADLDYDGDVDATDFTILESVQTGSGPPATLFTSGVGNPYFFTGRRLHFMEADLTGEDPAANKQVQYNRARHYDSEHGRWLQRDPIGYVDGMNLYEYVHSSPVRGIDPFGLRDGWDKAGEFITGAIDSALLGFPGVVRSEINVLITGEDEDFANTDSGFYQAGEVVETVGGTVVGVGIVKIGGKVLLKGGKKVVETAVESKLKKAAAEKLAKEKAKKKAKKKGKKARDAGKNEPHGDGGRALTKAEKQIKQLEEDLKNATTRKDKERIKNKIRHVRDTARKKKKGDTDHLAGCRGG